MQHVDPVTLAATLREAIPTGLLKTGALERVAARWCERHRYWHGPTHLTGMLWQVRGRATGEERDILAVAALYHDAVYDPHASDNEEASADLLRSEALDVRNPVIQEAAKLIAVSKWSAHAESPLGKIFFELDTFQLSSECPLEERLAYELAIFREYQWVEWSVYRQKRAEFLHGWAERFPEHRVGVGECLELLQGIRPRMAVYPGSFHPFHRGHLSILRQAETMFDKVIVAVGINRQKAGAVESAEKRCAELQAQLRYHEVVSFEGLLTDFVARMPGPVTIVRGVRDGTDLEAELRFSRFLNELRPGTNIAWIACGAELQHLSSSAIRELEAISPGAGRRYVPTAGEIYGLSIG